MFVSSGRLGRTPSSTLGITPRETERLYVAAGIEFISYVQGKYPLHHTKVLAIFVLER